MYIHVFFGAKQRHIYCTYVVCLHDDVVVGLVHFIYSRVQFVIEIEMLFIDLRLLFFFLPFIVVCKEIKKENNFVLRNL